MNEKDKERNPNQQRERQRARNISMMGFDSASSSFPAKLVIQSYRKKLKKANFRKQLARNDR